jgi:hypothetical protein
MNISLGFRQFDPAFSLHIASGPPSNQAPSKNQLHLRWLKRLRRLFLDKTRKFFITTCSIARNTPEKNLSTGENPIPLIITINLKTYISLPFLLITDVQPRRANHWRSESLRN